MNLDEVYLRRDNELFVFDRRYKRLFRVLGGERSEVSDPRVVALVITSPAKVLVCEPVELLSPSAVFASQA